jgi:hemoglobin-like flavoprotein
MALNPETLRHSFALVVEREPALTRRFYDIFFAKYPSVRPMFNSRTRDRQERMLQEALVAVLDHLEDAPWLETTLRSLGAKHIDYGVTREMYSWVGECLLQALAEAAGDAWTAEVEGAWSEAYGAIAGLMLQGAEDAEGTPIERAVRTATGEG